MLFAVGDGATDIRGWCCVTDYDSPAVAFKIARQGAITIESRRGDDRINAFVAAIDDKDTEAALAAERGFLALLDGSCRTPIAGHCKVDADRIHFRGMIVSPNGREAYETERTGARSDAAALGADAARELRKRAGEKFFTDFSGA